MPHELNENEKKSSLWSVIFSYSTQQQCTISQSDCDLWWKMDFIWQPAITSSWLDQEEAPKHFPKPTLHRKRSWSLFGGPLLVWCITAFWISVKPLHLRSMLTKSMRCTTNCNAYSRHWSTERTQFFSVTMPKCTTNTTKLEWIGLQSFTSSAIFTWPLASWLQLF